MTDFQAGAQAPFPSRLTIFFVRAEASWQDEAPSGLHAALVAASSAAPGWDDAAPKEQDKAGASTPAALKIASLPVLELQTRPEALASLGTALADQGADLGAEPGAEPGTQAYLFSSRRAVEALEQLDALKHLDRHADLFCVGTRALGKLRDLGFDGPAITAPTAAALENAIIAGEQTTLGCSQSDPAIDGLRRFHYFCAAEVSHNFAELEQVLATRNAPALAWHRLYAAVEVAPDSPALQAGLQAMSSQPEHCLLLVYSRALARRLGQLAAYESFETSLSNWRDRLPVLCLSRAIEVELEARGFRNTYVAQTPNEAGLAAWLQSRLPGLELRLKSAKL